MLNYFAVVSNHHGKLSAKFSIGRLRFIEIVGFMLVILFLLKSYQKFCLNLSIINQSIEGEGGGGGGGKG